MPIITNIILKGQRYEIVDAHSGYVTRQVNDLANYYLKSEVDTRLSAIPKFAITVVSSLPTSNISPTTVYLVKSGDESNNLFEEFIYVNNAWEKLGTQQVDLTPYARTDDMMAQLSTKASGADLSSLQSVVATKVDRTEFHVVDAGLIQLSTDFATEKTEVENKFSQMETLISDLTTGELTQYVKTVDADNTYATKTALATVDNKLSNYLTTDTASNTYLTKSDAASTYLTSANASNTYLTKTEASNTYATKTQLNQVAALPPGTIISYLGKSIPDGFLLCNGGTIQRSQFPNLVPILGAIPAFAGDGSTTLTLPNLQARFIEYTTDTNQVGQYVEAGLPNITGGLTGLWRSTSGTPDYLFTGASYYEPNGTTAIAGSGGLTETPRGARFDASRANRLYGGAQTVQPSPLRVLPVIKF